MQNHCWWARWRSSVRGGARGRLVLLLGCVAWLSGFGSAPQTPEPSREASRYSNRGVAFLEQFRFEDAVEAFRQVVRLQPESLAGHVNLGIALFNQRSFEAARQSLLRAQEVDDASPYVHYNLGLIHKLQGETEEALAAFERVRELDPDDSMTHYYLGAVLASLGRLPEAVSSFETTLALAPNNESALFSLGNALIRQGKREQGRATLMEFRELKQRFGADGTSAGLQYTEQGKYAEAIERRAARRPSQVEEETLHPTSLEFVDVTDASGLSFPPGDPVPPLPETIEARDYDRQWVIERVLPELGSGLAFRDLDSDGSPDLLFARRGVLELFFNREARFERSAEIAGSSYGYVVGVAVGDVDNDGDADLYLSVAGPNQLLINDGQGGFSPSADSAVAAGDAVSVSATFADVDHDGDLDIYVSNYLSANTPLEGQLRVPDELPGARNELLRNNGDGSFLAVAAETRTEGGDLRSLGSLFSDFDEDRDIDFVVVNEGAPVQLFTNDRIGTFTESSRNLGVDTSSSMRGVDSADFNRDGRFDLFFSGAGAALNLLLRGPSHDAGNTMFTADLGSRGLLESGVPGGRYGASFVDADNDADLDLLLVVNEGRRLATYYENTDQGFSLALRLDYDPESSGEGRALALADIDRDGDLDAAIGTTRGRVLVFRNEGGNRHPWLQVRARGLRSNLDGVGVKIEVKAGSSSLRREVRSSSGYFSQSDLPMHFGLGDVDQADYVRFLWPGGVKQIEMDLASGEIADIEELNRKGTSCPILYAWDGKQIRFVTDFLGGSAIGNLLQPGTYNYPDTSEVVKMESFPLRSRDGYYEMRWLNQLEEVIIYDKAALVAVDHPADVEVFPNERLMPAPPYPEDKLYAVRHKRAPVRVVDSSGEDQTELIIEKDRRYPSSFGLLPYKGYAKEHSLTMDLGKLQPDTDYVLLLNGWIDYADSSSNLAAAQAGVSVVTPYLEVSNGSGGFEKIVDEMGFPAGLPKTMLVDLSGLVGPGRDLLRLTTSMRLYWDQIHIAEKVDDTPLRVTELQPSKASLSFRGYPASVSADGRDPRIYDYSKISNTELWGIHEGFYTRYGDVGELVAGVDDLYVITHHGDEMTLLFDESRLPPLSAGKKRTFMAIADGFGKDMDLNAARPHRVAPLPFHGMSSYPYPPGSFPIDDRIQRYRNEYNTRYVGPDQWNPFHRLDQTAIQDTQPQDAGKQDR